MARSWAVLGGPQTTCFRFSPLGFRFQIIVAVKSLPHRATERANPGKEEVQTGQVHEVHHIDCPFIVVALIS